MCYGDSFTVGHSYCQLIEVPDYTIFCKGRRGSHMRSYARTIQEDTKDMDAVLIQDAGILRDTFEEDLDLVVSKLPTKLILLTTIPKLEVRNASKKWKRRYSNKNGFIRAYALANNLIVVDWEECADNADPLQNLTIDGIHPSEYGKEVLSECVEKTLLNMK